MRPLALLWFAVLSLTPLSAQEPAPPEPKFAAVTIDDKIQIGYGLAIADVDGDKKPDILLADKKQFVWYRNPGPEKAADPAAWQKFLIAENLTPKDNVCIAAQDIDGDGKCEIAVGGEWNPGDTENSGAVFYLIAPADRTQPWQAVKLHAEPTVHRMKWFQDEGGKWALVVVPLHGRGNKNGEGTGVKILKYTPPAHLNDAAAEWNTEPINSGIEMHMTHNLEPVGPLFKSSCIYFAAKEGIHRIDKTLDGPWVTTAGSDFMTWTDPAVGPVPNGSMPTKGIGELRLCSTAHGASVVTVEPMHGNELVDYTAIRPQGGRRWIYDRKVLTDKLVEGHALGCGKFLPWSDDQQVVVGWRGNPQNPTDFGVKMFTPLDDAHTKWRESLIDDKMSCEDLQIADLNGDGKLDIVASGRATKNVRIYFNATN